MQLNDHEALLRAKFALTKSTRDFISRWNPKRPIRSVALCSKAWLHPPCGRHLGSSRRKDQGSRNVALEDQDCAPYFAAGGRGTGMRTSALRSDAQPWLEFMYDLDLLFDQLNRTYWNGQLPRFRCEWSGRMITTWGCCYPDQGVIRISTLFRNRPVAELEAVMKHEMIHVRIRGHGKRFRHELVRIGLPNDVEGHFPQLTEITHRLRRALQYATEVPRCHIQIPDVAASEATVPTATAKASAPASVSCRRRKATTKAQRH